MYIEYDKESDAAFIWLQVPMPGVIFGEIWPAELNDRVGVLFNDEKKIVGIEILFASALLPAELLTKAQPGEACE